MPLATAQGGTTRGEVLAGVAKPMYEGYDVVFSNAMPQTEANGSLCMHFADWNVCSKVAEVPSTLVVETSTERFWDERKVGFQIDPQAFDRFTITATPSFVLIKDRSVPTPCAAGTCFAADSYALAAGDVSIDYALRFIQRTAPKFSREAQAFLAKMKGG